MGLRDLCESLHRKCPVRSCRYWPCVNNSRRSIGLGECPVCRVPVRRAGGRANIRVIRFYGRGNRTWLEFADGLDRLGLHRLTVGVQHTRVSGEKQVGVSGV